MKNFKILALFVVTSAASQSHGMANAIALAIPPLTGFGIGAMDLMKNRVAAKVLTGMAVSAPSAVIKAYSDASDIENEYNMIGVFANAGSGSRKTIEQPKNNYFVAKIPRYCGWYIGSMITYGIAIGAGEVVRALLR